MDTLLLGLTRRRSPLTGRRRCLLRTGSLARVLAVCTLWALVLTGVAAPQVAGDYRVGPRDQLEITVFGHTDLSGSYTVSADGSISFPLIGEVPVGGRTTRDIETTIAQRLADGFLKSPQVSVRVTEYRSQRVFVMGEVGQPGPVVLTGSLTLLEALAHAGGPSKTAGTEVIVLRRNEARDTAPGPLSIGQPGSREVARIGLEDLQGGRIKENIVLQDGDTILVPTAEPVFVLGQVKTPGPVPYTRDLTVFKALSLAGGATDLASARRIHVIRIVRGEKQEIKVKLTDLLQPGDTVMVPTRWF
ncbi:MAG: polysaccharide biosynthesis/export family protein [Armatimonadota bacterium]|nr:polysaccharide biosynthesis/export family protein [Armatimonadota bacterium]